MVDSYRDVPSPRPLSELSRAELEALLVELFGELSALKQVVAELRDEIARLKGLKGRPNIKPSGMDKGTEPANPARPEKRLGRGIVTPRVNIEDQVIKAVVPPGLASRATNRSWFRTWLFRCARPVTSGSAGSRRMAERSWHHCPRAWRAIFAPNFAASF
jgi:hypothetical protein